jgi:hypothetical protein
MTCFAQAHITTEGYNGIVVAIWEGNPPPLPPPQQQRVGPSLKGGGTRRKPHKQKNVATDEEGPFPEEPTHTLQLSFMTHIM